MMWMHQWPVSVIQYVLLYEIEIVDWESRIAANHTADNSFIYLASSREKNIYIYIYILILYLASKIIGSNFKLGFWKLCYYLNLQDCLFVFFFFSFWEECLHDCKWVIDKKNYLICPLCGSHLFVRGILYGADI